MFSCIVYIVNPASQNGATERLWPQLEKAMPQAFKVMHTTAIGDATALAEEAAELGADLVVSVGGDGTLNEICNGLMRLDESRRPALSLLPQATGGDFRRTMGYPVRPQAVAKLIARGKTRAIDIGKAVFFDRGGNEVTRHFINICSLGMSGVVDAAVNSSSKALGGKAAFLLGTAKAVLSFRPVEVSLSLDGGEVRTRKIQTIAVCNGRAFGGGMYVAPTADPSDGVFEVVSIALDGLSDLLKMGLIYRGEHLGEALTHYDAAKHVVATSPETVLLDVDGEQLGRLPITIDLVAQAIRFVC